jgi:isoquinoline 1-oxidoreductase subunit alpha
MKSIRIRVNGQTWDLSALPDSPLLWVLRDQLGLVGSKFGCGVGQCGACTVHVEGQPVRSCLTPVVAVGSAAVTTIEGLDSSGEHPVQRAWREIDVPQCGYCQAGQMMAAAALLQRSPTPSDEEIDAALAGHLCRCGTYLRIRAAVKRAGELSAGARR